MRGRYPGLLLSSPKRSWSALLVLLLLPGLVAPASARSTFPGHRDQLDEAREMLATGRYREALTLTTAGVVDEPDEEDWHVLHLAPLGHANGHGLA